MVFTEAATVAATEARIEIVGERRRVHDAAFRARVVEECCVPGARMRDLARRHGICTSLIYRWRRSARPVETAGAAARPDAAGPLRSSKAMAAGPSLAFVQQRGQRRKCGQAHKGCGGQSGLIGAGRSIEHPGRNLQPTIHGRPAQRAAESTAIRPRDRLMDGDLKAKPWMPRIQQLPKGGPVGVLKPYSTTRTALTWALVIGRRRNIVC